MKSLTKKYLVALTLLIIALASMFWFNLPWRVIATSGFLFFAGLDLWYIFAVKKERTATSRSNKWSSDTVIIVVGLLMLLFVLLEHLL